MNIRPVNVDNHPRPYCGPSAMSALTGLSVNATEILYKSIRQCNKTIRGVSHTESLQALERLNLDVVTSYVAGSIETLNQWVKRTYEMRKEHRGCVFLIEIGGMRTAGHYVTVKGHRVVCNHVSRPVGIDNYPMKRRKVRRVTMIKRKETSL